MTTTEYAPHYTSRFWAKAKPDRQQGPERIHLLEYHLADVGACFESLLAQPLIRQRLAYSGGLATLDDATAARLSLLAALHDIGKVNVGFQTRIWRDADFPSGRRRPATPGTTTNWPRCCGTRTARRRNGSSGTWAGGGTPSSRGTIAEAKPFALCSSRHSRTMGSPCSWRDV